MKKATSRTNRRSTSAPCGCAAANWRCCRPLCKPPKIHGDPEGDLLVVGWGSTLGAIEEAVDRLRAEGLRVSSLHLRFLSPLEPGLKRNLLALPQGTDRGSQLQRRARRSLHH